MGIGALIGGVAQGAGAVASANIQSKAAQQASQLQYQAAMQALAQQQGMFTTAQNALSPYYTAGRGALKSLSALTTPGSGQTAALEQMPGFQFQSQWGNLAATNQLAAQGLGGSAGPLGTALSQYNQGLAGTYYMNSVNALQNYANMGAGAAGTLGGVAGNFSGQIGQTTQQAGNALASGTLGSANAIAGGIQGATTAGTNALLMNQLLSNQNNQNGGTWGSVFGAPQQAPTAGW